MEDLKILVANEAESKEAQELLDILGYSKDAFENKSPPCWIAICDGLTYSDYNIGKSIWYTACPKEITIQELKDLVVLKRNSVNDATHEDYSGLKHLLLTHTRHVWGGDMWLISSSNFSKLKPIQKEKIVKECLVKDIDGSYWLAKDELSLVGVRKESIIEVPEGAECYKSNGKFYKDSGRLFYSPIAKVWSVSKSKDFKILWQREKESIIDKLVDDGMKFDNDKPRHSLLPKGAINSVIKVLEFGAKKYDADNWQKVDNAEERYYNAAMRHIDSWWNGEKRDPETGIHHLTHAATNLFFLMWFDNK